MNFLNNIIAEIEVEDNVTEEELTFMMNNYFNNMPPFIHDGNQNDNLFEKYTCIKANKNYKNVYPQLMNILSLKGINRLCDQANVFRLTEEAKHLISDIYIKKVHQYIKHSKQFQEMRNGKFLLPQDIFDAMCENENVFI